VLSRREIELSRFATERDMLRARVVERDARIRELEERLGALPDVEQLRADLERSEEDLQTVRRENASLRERASTLESELANAGRVHVERLEAELAQARSRAAKLEQDMSDALAWAPDPEDDLKRLQGVGPAFERALKALGVRTFAQIAEWSDEDIETMAPRLKTTAARIRRDDWIGSARKLCGRA
jgi:predicted flap endonuclease-1-like 5' DNA nuclease